MEASTPHNMNSIACVNNSLSRGAKIMKTSAALAVLALLAGVGLSRSYIDAAARGDQFATDNMSKSSTSNTVHPSFRRRTQAIHVNTNPIHYECPTKVQKSLNDKSNEFEKYTRDGEQFNEKITKSMTMEDLLGMKFDAWDVSFETVRDVLQPWKEEAFGHGNVRSGDVIYESASDIGLNAFITASTLKEKFGVTNLTFYGNDYLQESVDIAERVWSSEPVKATWSRAAQFCAADSTNLSFVPEAAFDVVFTGYIAPLLDPLNLLPEHYSSLDKYYESTSECRAEEGTERHNNALRAQAAQEEWYASWVTQMLRLVKPGGIITVEANAESVCKDPEDWGGVDRTWWAQAVEKYNWDVDVDSIMLRDMINSGGWQVNRYHVLMRRRGGHDEGVEFDKRKA